MTYTIETQIYIETPMNEVTIHITGQVQEAQAAATDCYGRATEMPTDADAYATFISIGNIEYTDDEICDLFGLESDQWEDMVFEALMEEFENENDPYDDDLPF
jgi:hypothetical protein